MKLSASEEYGLRCLVRLARHEREGFGEPLGIPRIAVDEGMSEPNTAKILRQLRQAGLVRAFRGAQGGYRLAHDPATLTLRAILSGLDGPGILQQPCSTPAGCVHVRDCTLRGLWRELDDTMAGLLERVTLADLLEDPGHLQEATP
ncbi:MAG: Rrf2 family transcriptional regulator [Pseudomonadota bacterium]